jgi:hypothetical protein
VILVDRVGGVVGAEVTEARLHGAGERRTETQVANAGCKW